MKYTNSTSFRQALEAKLRSEYPAKEIQKQRKLIAFERFMFRLSDQWILKGGYALQLRTQSARTTQDIDLLIQDSSPEKIERLLWQELEKEVGDYFDFLIEPIEQNENEGRAIRFRVISRLASREFERFHIDIGYQDPVIAPLERLKPPDFLAFAELETHSILCYSVSQHIAEKLHAIILPRPKPSSRVKDMVDILLFASTEITLELQYLKTVIQQVFFDRKTDLPNQFNHIPGNWRLRYNRLNQDVGLPFTNFDEAVLKLQTFINPVLQNNETGIWNPDLWKWMPK